MQFNDLYLLLFLAASLWIGSLAIWGAYRYRKGRESIVLDLARMWSKKK